jgi:hypothetical protein
VLGLGALGVTGCAGTLGVSGGKRLSPVPAVLTLGVMRESGAGLDTSPEQANMNTTTSQRAIRMRF